MGKIRGTHSSPGVYSNITDIQYAAKTLGITTLGLVGETLKGPAFEPIMITNYAEFKEMFGGTSAKRFKDSLYPKYELPYIAKSYLSASDQLYVCRVLGLSGYNAGPAFIITAEGNNAEKHVIAILRSRGSYKKYVNVGDECNPISKYDQLIFDCDEVEIEPYVNASVVVKCDDINITSGSGTTFPINAINYGQFTLVAKNGGQEIGRYAISLNAGSKDYIYNVLGESPTEGNAALFVEELYDLNLKELIESGSVTEISPIVQVIPETVINAVSEPVKDFVNIPASSLKRKNVGQTFLCAESGDLASGETNNGYAFYETTEDGTISGDTQPMKIGYVYKVKSVVNPQTGVREYIYVEVKDSDNEPIHVDKLVSETKTLQTVKAVKVLAYDSFIAMQEYVDETGNTIQGLVSLNDLSDYHDQFRCASTPWFVSELKGDAKSLEVKKLFRFHTITDGTEANTQVKVSIENVNPDNGTFDVIIRDFNDSDGNKTILESYKSLNMIPGSSKYIGLQIGTLDGAYEVKSSYVMVEIIENDMTKNCVPCGFLGYPVREYYTSSGETLSAPTLTYNKIYDSDIKEKRQYFGMSDIVGIDEDILYYKGKCAYTEEYIHGYTNAFHLDSTLSSDVKDALGLTVTVDGDPETAGIVWDAVSPSNTTSENKSPIIGSEQDMEGTIYEDAKLRKFTACFCGGFDGWDIYRNSRTNTDEFKANRYKGTITNGHGQTFSKIENGTQLALAGNCITSDYYAYLAGINQFEQSERYLINLFATPGIDYVNNTMLVNDALDMVEEKRQDTFYVVTTPDKPWGSSDAIDEMYSSSDAVSNLEDTGIDTYSMATSYPWVKYFDKENNIYINLPATKDMLRNMADVDNKRYPWIAPAGITNGKVDCTKMHFFAKLEDEDTLYDGRINPLKSFSKDGVKIWGNKTLYSNETPMDRINVVRLLLYMKRVIIESTRQLIFEPNDETLSKQFVSIVSPILAEIKENRGITDYLPVQASQTAEQIDAHEMSANIIFKPTQTLEYLEINFTVTPQSVSFDDVSIYS